jgi:protein disulfide-isomerase
MLTLQVGAQQEGIHWQQDLESAKALAKQSGRLVLVHFWTPHCAPCVTLDHTVFNQPGVASAIEAEFVPVKLNANENPATAQGFGITRVPTDVILTPDGQVVGKLISPPTPAGYVAELTQVARENSSRAGQGFANAASSAPQPSQINAAYAKLQLAPETQAAVPQPAGIENQPSMQVNPAAMASQAQSVAPPAIAQTVPATPSFAASQSAGNPSLGPIATTPPQQYSNPYADGYSAPNDVTPAIANYAVPPGVNPAAAIAGVNTESVQPQTPIAHSAAVVTTPVVVPDSRQLPPGAPPLGFDGYCPVSMRNQWKWVAGDPRWGVVHRGRTYWFASQAEQQMFWTDPDRYAPALSGMDPVMAIDHKQQVPGKREHSIDYDNLFYMFSNEATLQQFTANPERYAVGVRQAMGIERGRLVR